jgi:hypothetical protein
MLLTSLEGAADAVRVTDFDADSGQHDMHHPQHGEHDSSPDDGDEAGTDDHHACHCNAHLPPLAFAPARMSRAAAPERATLTARQADFVGGPPPLPPPIA